MADSAVINSRQIACNILDRIERESGFSGILIDSVLKGIEGDEREDFSSPSYRNKAFISRLVYGVLENKLAIDYVIDRFTHNTKRMNIKIRNILRVACYQMIYLDKIPYSAAINEAVEITKASGKQPLSGFVNGLLREISRGSDYFKDAPVGTEGISIRHSVPLNTLRMWEKGYADYIEEYKKAGKGDFIEDLARSFNEISPRFIRVNTHKISSAEFENKLKIMGVLYKRYPYIEGLKGCLEIVEDKAGKLDILEGDLFFYQDVASQIACFTLGAKKGERIFDVCGAPGGKSFNTSMYMQGEGELFLGDIHEFKLKTVEQRAKKLSVNNIKTICRDGAVKYEEEDISAFDRVICDVPCSGLGVMGRKPEIRYKKLDDFKELPELQYAILRNSASLVKKGGIIQYSTCTLSKRENEKVTDLFLFENTNFEPDPLPLKSLFDMQKLPESHSITLFPHIHKSDGFYISRFKRVK